MKFIQNIFVALATMLILMTCIASCGPTQAGTFRSSSFRSTPSISRTYTKPVYRPSAPAFKPAAPRPTTTYRQPTQQQSTHTTVIERNNGGGFSDMLTYGMLGYMLGNNNSTPAPAPAAPQIVVVPQAGQVAPQQQDALTSPIVVPQQPAAAPEVKAEPAPIDDGTWKWWLLLLAIAGGGGWLYFRKKNNG